MPIFEYKCDECNNVMEILVKNTSSQKHKCSKCGSTKLTKLLSGFAVGQNKEAQACSFCPKGLSQAECNGHSCSPG